LIENMKTTPSLKKIASECRAYIKRENIGPYVMVKVCRDTLIIDNLPFDSAAMIAQRATGFEFKYLSQSMTTLIGG